MPRAQAAPRCSSRFRCPSSGLFFLLCRLLSFLPYSLCLQQTQESRCRLQAVQLCSPASSRRIHSHCILWLLLYFHGLPHMPQEPPCHSVSFPADTGFLQGLCRLFRTCLKGR